MKKFLFLFIFSLSLQAQPGTLINLLVHIIKCPSITSSVLIWNGTTTICATLGPGLSLVGNTLSVTAGSPQWQTESISLSTLASTTLQTNFIPSKTPINGLVFWWYNSTEVSLQSSGVVPWSSSPLVFNLPTGWQSTDTITIAYQSQ